MAGYETSSFVLRLGAPRATPTSIVEILDRAVNDALATPEIERQFGELGAIIIKGNTTQFAAMLDKEIARWRNIVEKSGVKKERLIRCLIYFNCVGEPGKLLVGPESIL